MLAAPVDEEEGLAERDQHADPPALAHAVEIAEPGIVGGEQAVLRRRRRVSRIVLQDLIGRLLRDGAAVRREGEKDEAYGRRSPCRRMRDPHKPAEPYRICVHGQWSPPRLMSLGSVGQESAEVVLATGT